MIKFSSLFDRPIFITDFAACHKYLVVDFDIHRTYQLTCENINIRAELDADHTALAIKSISKNG